MAWDPGSMDPALPPSRKRPDPLDPITKRELANSVVLDLGQSTDAHVGLNV